ncbi:MAG: hypothetical protein IPF48_13980 [Sphingomonadales bacterium]|nr:hypothetical protein [Sphingomonadales bacterium]
MALAREFGIRRVVVPHCSGTFSALGCLVADMSYAEQRSLRMVNGAGTDTPGWYHKRNSRTARGTTVEGGHDHKSLKIDIVGLVATASRVAQWKCHCVSPSTLRTLPWPSRPFTSVFMALPPTSLGISIL